MCSDPTTHTCLHWRTAGLPTVAAHSGRRSMHLCAAALQHNDLAVLRSHGSNPARAKSRQTQPDESGEQCASREFQHPHGCPPPGSNRLVIIIQPCPLAGGVSTPTWMPISRQRSMVSLVSWRGGSNRGTRPARHMENWCVLGNTTLREQLHQVCAAQHTAEVYGTWRTNEALLQTLQTAARCLHHAPTWHEMRMPHCVMQNRAHRQCALRHRRTCMRQGGAPCKMGGRPTEYRGRSLEPHGSQSEERVGALKPMPCSVLVQQ